MQAEKRSAVARDAKSGRYVDWRAKTTVSQTGSVTVSVDAALRDKDVKSQLEAVRRIREASSKNR
jgi:hypothetical protein